MVISKPLIGLICDYKIKEQVSQLFTGYCSAVLKAGGLPFLIPVIEGIDIFDILDSLDGIVFTGGQDVEPTYFDEVPNPKLGQINPLRDRLEIPLCIEAMARHMPILGICRGIQLMNIAMGGTIYQDLESQWDGDPLQKHSQLAPDWYGSHQVDLVKGSRLWQIFGALKLQTNSFHHQAIKKPAPCFKITAKCGDGVIEAIESPSHNFQVGVQWHPERMWGRDGRMLGLFEGLVHAATNN